VQKKQNRSKRWRRHKRRNIKGKKVKPGKKSRTGGRKKEGVQKRIKGTKKWQKDTGGGSGEKCRTPKIEDAKLL